MAILPLIGVAASAGLSVLGGISQANAASYQAQIARNNATIARQNAGYSAQAGSVQTEEAGLQARSQDANLRAAIGANGLDVNTGTPANVEVSQREIGQLNAQTVANKAAQQVYGYQAQATSYASQAELEQSQVLPDILGGGLKAASSVFGNAEVDGFLSPGSSITPPSPLSLDDDQADLMPAPSLVSTSPTLPGAYAWMASGGG